MEALIKPCYLSIRPGDAPLRPRGFTGVTLSSSCLLGTRTASSLAELLVQRKADLVRADAEGYTCLHWAARCTSRTSSRATWAAACTCCAGTGCARASSASTPRAAARYRGSAPRCRRKTPRPRPDQPRPWSPRTSGSGRSSPRDGGSRTRSRSCPGRAVR